MDNTPESILIEGLAEGNTKIFDYLFHYYYSGLVAFSIKYVGSRTIAEDIVQDFFYKLWLNRNELSINQTIKSYFFTSVKNRSIDHSRHKAVEGKAAAFLMEKGESEAYDEDAYLVEAELRKQINAAISKLPDTCRKVFLLNRLGGYKPQEIAENKKISVRTVEGHIGKALKILRAELKPYLPGYLILLIFKGLG